MDHTRRAIGREVHEFASIAPERNVRDDVQGLARLRKSALDRLVEGRGDDELMRKPACAQDRREPCQRPRHRARRIRPAEESVQLVVERANPTQDADVLGDACQALRPIGRAIERASEMLRRSRRRGRRGDVTALLIRRVRCASQHDHEATCEQCAENVREVVARRVSGRRGIPPGLLAQDRHVQLLQRSARLQPELVDERRAGVVIERRSLPLVDSSGRAPASVAREAAPAIDARRSAPRARRSPPCAGRARCRWRSGPRARRPGARRAAVPHPRAAPSNPIPASASPRQSDSASRRTRPRSSASAPRASRSRRSNRAASS